MVEKVIIAVNALFFISKVIGVYKNAQYVKTGVASHMQREGMTERQATMYEHSYAGHQDSIKVCMAGNCSALA